MNSGGITEWSFDDYRRGCNYTLRIETEMHQVYTINGVTNIKGRTTKMIIQTFFETQEEWVNNISYMSEDKMESVYAFLDGVSTGQIDMTLDDLNDYLNL